MKPDANTDFRAERNRGIRYIAAAVPCTLGLWLAIDWLLPPLAGMGSVTDRLLLAVKCLCVAVLLCLVTGVEAVAHERLFSPAFDPLAGFETRRLRVNQRYLQNTLEQVVILGVGLVGLAIYSPGGAAMRAVVATTAVWIVARFAFWIGYHLSAAGRGLGAPGLALNLVVLLYVVARIGKEIGGTAGVLLLTGPFALIEFVLFWSAARPGSAQPPRMRR